MLRKIISYFPRKKSIFAIVDKKSAVNNKSKINRFVRFYNSRIERFSYVGPSSRIVDTDIGAFTSISWDCQIGIPSHEIHHISSSPIFSEEKNGTGTRWLTKRRVIPPIQRTKIGNDVWIGARAIVMPGIKIGDGAVVGAGSIVTKNVPEYSIVAGVPAKVIKKRFDDDICDQLMALKWWDLDEKILRSGIGFFQSEVSKSQLNQLAAHIANQKK